LVKIEAHFRSIAKSGETKNGDAVVIRTKGAATLIAVIDALGHGPAAAETAAVAVDYLEQLDDLSSVRAIVDGLHAKMRDTRGAAVTICVVELGHLVGCSVGNVELRSVLDSIPAVTTPGIVGSRLRNMRLFEARLSAGERLVLFSDGLSASLRATDAAGHSGLAACDALMRRHRREHDDATVVVVDVKA
jgi:negative regulator of sigma-B (phosphoserine phosphatase)